MASSGERRMLFDTRGRRRHVIRVVYAVLALLMGASLFLVVGPFNLAELVGGSSSNDAAEVLDEQSQRIERRLAQDPTNEALLLSLARSRIGAANAQVEETSTGARSVPPEAKEDFEAALQSWNRYLKNTEQPSASAAQLVAATFFGLAESASTSLEEVEANIATAAAAQQIAAERQPNLGSLSSLAIYQYFDGDFAAGDESGKQAAAKAGTKAEGKNVEKQLAEYRKRAKKFTEQKEEIAKVQRKAGKEQLENPFSGLAAPPGG